MQRYIGQRLLFAVISLVGLTIIVFIFLRAVPGDAVTQVLGESAGASPQQVAELRHALHLDDPLPVQYVHWVAGLLHGDMGKSLFTGHAVAYEIRERVGATLELAVLSLMLSLIVGVTAGVASALARSNVLRQTVRVTSILGLALPNFWIGTMIIVFGARWFGWVPPAQYRSFFQHPLENLEQFIIPALVIGLGLAASLARMTRSAVLEVRREDYIRTAFAKGLTSRMVLFRHILRTSMIPVVTLFAIQIGFVIAGAVVIENVFSLPGSGRLILDSISKKDYPLVEGIILIYGIIIVSINLLTDILYGVLDPRVRLA
jgi:peptide/nickel transport system permease protein